jgi:hypothetical protein
LDTTERFFPGTNRRVIIGSPTKQSTTGRICVPIRMPLTGESLVSAPDWLGECYEAVSQFASDMTPEIEQIADITVAFANDKPKGQLFADPSAKVPSAELKAFSVQRCGEDDQPDVELAFKLYANFSRDFWTWLGEMAGKEVYMAFPKSLGAGMAKPKGEQQVLAMTAPAAEAPVDQPVTQAETDAFAADAKPEDTPGTPEYEEKVRKSLGAEVPKPRMERITSKPRKSGPADLKKFHLDQAAKGKTKPNGGSTAAVN